MDHGFPPPPPHHSPGIGPKVHHIGAQFEQMHLHPNMNTPYSDIHSLSSGELDPHYNPSVNPPVSFHEPVSYIACKFTKLKPESWARVRRTLIPFSQEELCDEVKKRKARGPSAMEEYRKLTKFMQGHIDRLIQDRDREERDPDVEYVLAALNAERKNVGRHKSETVSIQVILRRQLRPQVMQDGARHLNIPGEIVDLHDRSAVPPPIMMPGGGHERNHYEPYPPHEQGPRTPGPFPSPQIVDDRFPQHHPAQNMHSPPPHIHHMHPPEAPIPPHWHDTKFDKKGDKRDDRKDGKDNGKKENDKDKSRTKIVEVHHIHESKGHKSKGRKRVDRWFKNPPINSDSDTDYDSFSETTPPTSHSGHSYDYKSKHYRHQSPHRSDVYREPTREHRRKSPLPTPHSRRPLSHHGDLRETIPARTRPLPSSRRTTGYIEERPQYHRRTGNYEGSRYYENDRVTEAPTSRRPRVLEDDRPYESDRYRGHPLGRTRTFEDDRLHTNDRRYETPMDRPGRFDTATYREDMLRRRDMEREWESEDYIDGRY